MPPPTCPPACAGRRRRADGRRPGHAGGPGRRELLHLARRAPRPGARAGGAARGAHGGTLSSMAARKGRSWCRITTGVLMALVCLVLLYQFWLFAQVVWYNYRAPGSSAIMREELSRLREGNPDFKLQYEWVPYDKINRNLKRAVVASEDSNFTVHDGIEWDAIRKAWEYNQRQ
ncbi:hypothetical protein G6F60_014228 [Rhizopus arrhizus]|nr:hypothetical protein G6F60_014228 [Rhizopus arrhizus]